MTNHIIIREYQINNLSIDPQSGVWPDPPSIAVSGYTPIAIVGYYATVQAVPYSVRIIDGKANIALRNYTNQTVRGSLLFYVLYTKN